MAACAPSARAARRGRPSREQAEAIDRDILDCARACFLEAGFAATTMDGIAERAGVTRATLYLRHPDKESLLRAVIEDRLANWSSVSARTDWMLGTTLDQRLRHYGRTMLKWSRDPEVVAFRRLIEIEPGGSAVSSEFRRMFRSPMLDLLAREIARDGSSRGSAVRDPAPLASLFLAMLTTRFDSPEPVGATSDDLFVDRVVEVFIAGRSAW